MDARIIAENIIAALLHVDRDWIIRYANARAATLLRRPVRELVNQPLWTVFPDLEGSNAASVIRSTIRGRVQRQSDFFSPSLYNWFAMWAAPGPDEDVYVFFRDVTDRERAIQTEAVQESVRRILMDAPIAISITRGREHRYELLNHASRALVGGRNLEGLTARNALNGVDPALFDILDRVYESGETVTLRDLKVTYDRLGDGTLYTGTFDVTYQPMRDATGEVSGLMQTAIETTESANRGESSP